MHQLEGPDLAFSSQYNVSLRHARQEDAEDKATTKSDFVASLRRLSILLTKDLVEQSMIGPCVNWSQEAIDGDMRVLARNIVRSGARRCADR